MKPFNDPCMSPMEKDLLIHKKPFGESHKPEGISPMEKDLLHHQKHLIEIRVIDDFKNCIKKIVENYIKMIDTKISIQNLNINKAELYMKEKIVDTTADIFSQLFTDGKVKIEFTYDPEKESLNIGGIVIEQ